MVMKLIFIYCIWSISFNSINTNTLLFYIQRNLNSNIVVYKANFDTAGILIKDNPIKSYWVMNSQNGKIEPLSFIEKKMAYGIKCIPTNVKNQYKVQLVADKNHSFVLKQQDPFKAMITTVIDGITIKLTSFYVEADNSSIWPKVQFIIIEGTELESNKIITKKLYFN